MINQKQKAKTGSSLEDWLREEGLYEECHTEAVKRVIAGQIECAMREKGLTKKAMAELMHTSRAALDRLLDPNNDSVTLATLKQAAATLGKQIKLELI
jgi:predicted XRE-type DNA-binding protein